MTQESNEAFERLINKPRSECGWTEFPAKWPNLDAFASWVINNFQPKLAPCWRNHEGARIELEILFDWFRDPRSPRDAIDAYGALNTFLHRASSFEIVCQKEPCKLSTEYQEHIESLKKQRLSSDN